MKKITSLFLVLLTALSFFVSCSDTEDKQKISVGYLAGPTGMGLARLIMSTPKDSEKYAFTPYTDPNNAIPDLISGTIDMACLPTNAAANLYNKGKDISVIAVNTLGSLYVIADKNTNIETISDLEGKTVHASVPGSTTKPILDFILNENGVNASVAVESQTHEDLIKEVKDSNGAMIAVLPEPKVSATLLQAGNYEIKLNLSEEWSKVSDQPLAMGCIVARNDFLKAHPKAVSAFLKDYKASVDYITKADNRQDAAQSIVHLGIIPKLPLAISALKNLEGSIVLITGQEMRTTLSKFYDVLLASSAESIGGKKPLRDFYYE